MASPKPGPVHAGIQPLEPRLLMSADILNGPPDTFLTGFGEPNSSYFAQTFRPTDDGFADELTFQAEPVGVQDDNNFRVLVTELAPGFDQNVRESFEPTSILFESDPITIPFNDPITDVVVDLGGLSLAGGTDYAFIIDSFVENDGTINQARAGVKNGYDDGRFFFLNFTALERPDHFASRAWRTQSTTEDLSFSLTFLSAPIADAGGPYAGVEGDTITLDASASTDPDDDIVLYEWDTDFDGVNFDADLSSATPFVDVSFGDDFAGTVAVRATDAENQTDIATASVTIANAVPSLAVTNPNATDGDAEQFSDDIAAIRFDATDVVADTLNATVETSTDGGATFSAGLPAGLSFNGSADQVGDAVWTIDGTADLAPGDYTFRVTVSDEDGGVSQATADLTIAAEDAAATYTGPQAVSTQADGSFSVDLRAFVEEVPDGQPGDFSTATATFRLTPDTGGDVVELTAPVAPDAGDPSSDIVAATFSGQLAADAETAIYTLEVLVGGNYVGLDATVLTVARPDDSRAFGAGSIVEQQAEGGSVTVTNFDGSTESVDLSIADDSRVRFGVFADFRRNDQLRGRFTTVFRDAAGEWWVLYATELTSFTTEADADNDASTRDFSANLIGNARLINLSTGQRSGSLTMVVDITDNRTRGIDDTIGFSLWDGDQLALSSNWDGTQTVEQDLDRGNTRVVVA
ncbi:MAG: putative Ig domain-containing protein [Planctomycetota bacterium]